MGSGPLGYYLDRAADQAAPAHRYAAGRACPDYVLAKSLGSHWRVAADQATYAQVHQGIGAAALPGGGANWLPHLVSIRNRKLLKQNIWLSTLIADIRKAKPNITRFFCAHCRDNDEAYYDDIRKTVGSGSLGSRTGR
jgi:hypothetical protein